MKIEAPKPRNPVVAYQKKSGAGVHGKTRKAERKNFKQELKAALSYSRIGLLNKY